MKKFIFVSAIITLSVVLNAQTPYYYYNQEGKQYLELDTEHAFVSVADEKTADRLFSSNKVKQRQPLRIDIPEKTQSESQYNRRLWAVLSVDGNLPDEAYLAKLSEIKNSRKSIIVAPYFKNRHQEVIGLSNFFYVKLKSLSDTTLLRQEAEKEHAVIVHQNQFMPLWFTASVTENSKYNAMELSNRFHESGLFRYAEPDIIVGNLSACVDDTYFDSQWGLKNTGQYGGTDSIDIKACDAWQISTGENVVVAVLDSGVELDHPDLAGNIYPLSYDCLLKSSPQTTLYGEHGTACAGIIGAIRNNGEGAAGVAPDCRLMAVSTPFGGSFLLQRQLFADGINWAWQNGANVISCSWGNDNLHEWQIENAVNNAVTQGRGEKGCIIVACSHNQNWDHVVFPASHPDVIAVGAISPCGERKSPTSCDGENWGSNYGEMLDIMAPGVLIATTDRQDTEGYNPDLFLHQLYGGNKTSDFSNKDYTKGFMGTSSATPHVSGVAALILSVNPELTQQEVKDIIYSTAQKIRTDLYTYSTTPDRPYTWNEEMGYGLVDAYAAVQAALETCTVELKDETIDDTQTVEGCVVNVDNVTLESSADVTISGRRRVEITSLQMADGSSLAINNGTTASQSNVAPIASVSRVAMETARANMEETAEPGATTLLDDNLPRLYQNRPNPFTGQTTIGYYLPENSGDARLRIINTSGMVVKTVDIVNTGENQIVLDANSLPSGIYFYSLLINGQTIDTKHMVVK